MFNNASKLFGTVWTHTKQMWKTCAVDPIFEDESNLACTQRPNILRGDSFVRARLELGRQRQIYDMQGDGAVSAAKMKGAKIADADGG